MLIQNDPERAFILQTSDRVWGKDQKAKYKARHALDPMAEKENQSGSGKSKKMLFILGVLFILVVLSVGGYCLSKNFFSSSLNSPGKPYTGEGNGGASDPSAGSGKANKRASGS